MAKTIAAALLATLYTSVAVADCDFGNLPNDQRTSSASFDVGYRLEPPKIAVAEPFSMVIEICNKDGSSFTGAPVVNAHMPLHGHGMNYRPRITKTDEGTFRAEGFLFHMPGKWQFKIDIEGNGKAERVTLDRAFK